MEGGADEPMAEHLQLPKLLDRMFRANPGYRLTVFDQLPLEQQRTLAGLKEDPDFYGLLSGYDEGLRGKAVSQQTALLFLSLQQPGRLPFYVLDHADADTEGSIAQLVSDGILQAQVDGTYVSGPLAHVILFPSTDHEVGQGYLGRLSLDAIRYAACLEGLGTIELSRRLYLYNRIPVSGYWRSLIDGRDATDRYWGIPQGIGSLPGGAGWHLIDTGSDDWVCWRQAGGSGRGSGRLETCKLYVSPQPQHVAVSLASTVEVLSNVGAPSLKIGGTLSGLLRPDKIVCYFESFNQMIDAASELAMKLQGVPVHGVPFTCELSGGGLISWGVDPASRQQAFGWMGPQSWRLWVTNHLATSLLAADHRSVDAWKFALDRLSLEGVDPRTWAPIDRSRLSGPSDGRQEAGGWK